MAERSAAVLGPVRFGLTTALMVLIGPALFAALIAGAGLVERWLR